jgi:hypothetical protein
MWVERQGQSMRRLLRLNPVEPLDPFKLAPLMKAEVYSPYDVLGLPSSDQEQLLVRDPDGWSAGSIRLPTGEIAIILNPRHADTRKRASLMEELAHMYLKHTPSQLIMGDGLALRTFKKTQETQAYWVGTAALVPLQVLERAQSKGVERRTLAGSFGVSIDLVTFRERVTGVRLC